MSRRSHPAQLEALRAWTQKAWEVIDAAQGETEVALTVVPAALERGEAGVELDLEFKALARLRGLLKELDSARDAALPPPTKGPLEQAGKSAAELDRIARGFSEQSMAGQPFCVATAFGYALQDPSGLRADRTIETALHTPPTRTRRVGPGEHRVEDRKIGLDRVLNGIARNYATYQGKPGDYFATAVRDESQRDFDALAEADRDRLGLTPKKSEHLPPELRRKLNNTAQAEVEHANPAVEVSIMHEDACGARELEEYRGILCKVIPLILRDQQRAYAIKVLLQGTEPKVGLCEVGRDGDWSFHTATMRKLKRHVAQG